MQDRWWMRPMAVAVGLLVGCLLMEAAVRAYFAWSVGPRVLLYGTGWFRNTSGADDHKKQTLTESETRQAAAEWAREDSVERHGQALQGYTKFFPNETKTTQDPDTGERLPVRINRHGFRGPDFEVAKPPGVVRVLTLGSSSTFGYYNPDDATYPVQLQRALDAACGGTPRFEVINFAIPHATAERIVAMFRAEGLALSPDVVTFYEGRNDSTLVTTPEGWVERAYGVATRRLLLAALLDQLLVGERVSLTDSSRKFEPHAAERSEVFLGHVARLHEAARERGVRLVVANQQATSRSPLPHDRDDRLKLKGITYAQETGEIRARLGRGDSVSAFEYSLLVHRRLMQDLEQWADREGLPFVDMIGALDQDRHLLLSWVHLHPDANRVIAARFAEALQRQFCPAAR